MGVLVHIFMVTTLLVVIHIPYTQKWARGFTEPSRYGCVCEFIKLNEVTVVEIFHGDIFLYFMYSALLVIIHIPKTQNWALPFPCSKTKSKISFSHGWAQAVITTRRYVLGNTQSEERCGNGKRVLGYILYRHNVVDNNTYSAYTKMGATLPVLKNEIKDFFFARLGTGRTSQNRRATAALAILYKIIRENNRKFRLVIFELVILLW